MSKNCSFSAFTLLEVMMAIGITATVALPLLALLGMSFETSADSEVRFAAAGIVHDVAAELRQSTPATGPLIAVGNNEAGETEFWDGGTESLDGMTVFVGYDVAGSPSGELEASVYETGFGQAGSQAAFHVRIAFEEVLPPSGDFESPRLLRATVTVKSPGAEERFSTLLNATNQFEQRDDDAT